MSKTKLQQEAEQRYPAYVYRNRHGKKVEMNKEHALMYGDKMTPLNNNAKELQPPVKNSQGEIINKTIHQ